MPGFRRITDKIIGRYHTESLYQKRYVGIFKAQPPDFLSDDSMDVIRWKGEFLEVHEDKMCALTDMGENDNETEYLLPIACDKKTAHRFLHNDEYTDIEQSYIKHFYYYRIKNNTVIKSTNTVYYGKPIKLKLNPRKSGWC